MPSLKLPKKRKVEVNASIIKRIIAFLIDIALVMVIVSPLLGSASQLLPQPQDADFLSTFETYDRMFSGDSSLVDALSLINVFLVFVIFLYFVIFEYKLHQTPGKMVFKIFVRPTDKKKKGLTIWQCILRNFFLLFNIIILIDIISLAIKGERLSDIAAKTKVVEVASV